MRHVTGRSRVAVVAAWLLAAAATATSGLAVALPVLGGDGYLDELVSTPELSIAVSFSVTGAWLVGRAQARRMGWLLVAIGLSAALYAGSVSWTAYVLRGDADATLPPGSDAALATAWVSGWAWFPAWLLVATVLPQVLPYGRPLPERFWRLPLVLAGVFCALAVLLFMVSPGPVSVFGAIDNPVASARASRLLQPVETVMDGAFLLLLVLSLASLVVRLRRAGGDERRQVGWVGYAVAVVVLTVVLVPSTWLNLVVLLIPAGIAVAAVRYRLYDLDVLVSRTLIAGLLLGGAAVVYIALVAWVGALVGGSGGVVPFVAAFAVALCFHPARIRLQRMVDRLFHGRRGDPYSLLQDLDRTLREAETPGTALSAAVGVLRDGLRLPGVGLRVRLPDGRLVEHTSGDLSGPSAVIPLELHEQQVGELVVARRDPRTPPGTLADADIRVLRALAGPLASAAFAVRLSGDLTESHRKLLEARESERRRLRRDLHDGLGPQLAGIVMGLDVAGSSLARNDTARAVDLTARTLAQARTAVEDVRRLARGLRPPALDDLGLVGALHASGPAAADGGPRVVIESDGDLEALPAAAEVAAFRIASEAITNAVRHAEATRVEVRLSADEGAVRVRVSDDGRGVPPGTAEGIGLISMRERAIALGGWCRVTSGHPGTTVLAHLPFPVAAPEPAS